MANPAKRKVDGTEAGTDGAADDSTDEATTSEPTTTKPKAASASKRVTPPKARGGKSEPSRYTPPNPASHRGPSPRWVPVLMFALWGLGLLVIILNYMGVMPGTGDDGSGWYLITGLGAILAGIMVATQYR